MPENNGEVLAGSNAAENTFDYNSLYAGNTDSAGSVAPTEVGMPVVQEMGKIEAVGFEDIPDVFAPSQAAVPVPNISAEMPLDLTPMSPTAIMTTPEPQQLPAVEAPELPAEYLDALPQAVTPIEPQLDLTPMSPTAIMTTPEVQLIPAVEAPELPAEYLSSLQEATPMVPEPSPLIGNQDLDISAIANSLEEPMSNMDSLSSMLPPTLESIAPVSAETPMVDAPFLPSLGNDGTNASIAPAIPNLIPTAPGVMPTVKKEAPVGSRTSILVVIIFSLLSLAAMVWFGYILLAHSNAKEKDLGIQNTREFAYEGFSLYLPDNLVAEIIDGEFFVADKENTWSAVITLQYGSFNTLVSNKSQLTDYYETFGYISEDPKEKEIHGTRFVTMEVSMGAEKVLVAYARATGTQIFGIILTNEEHEYEDSSLAEIGKLLATSKYNGPTYTWPEGFTVDMFRETFKAAE